MTKLRTYEGGDMTVSKIALPTRTATAIEHPWVVDWAPQLFGVNEQREYRLVAYGKDGSALYRWDAPVRMAAGVFAIRRDGEMRPGNKLAYRRRSNDAYTYNNPPEGGRWKWLDPEARTDEWARKRA